MIEVIDGQVRYENTSYGVGETLTLTTEEEKRLVSRGVAKRVGQKQKGKADSKKNQEPDPKTESDGQGPNTGIPLEGE
ncbi:hypothetical protein E4K67_17435 [Desulfosporosinus fructosivorans]|uniref:Uncharacterized protein n=1 Tax=Desulfosporosinus fructosivorans TaxID=2018669 RepID=A0A4Z0R1E6_9FIRM|nr:hypothetical protein [Desulfosporosinus fructosivorans]TGE36882.1 hypothetical protein E4K67_17435 [Desulfosporosinus fructosivorans]